MSKIGNNKEIQNMDESDNDLIPDELLAKTENENNLLDSPQFKLLDFKTQESLKKKIPEIEKKKEDERKEKLANYRNSNNFYNKKTDKLIKKLTAEENKRDAKNNINKNRNMAKSKNLIDDMDLYIKNMNKELVKLINKLNKTYNLRIQRIQRDMTVLKQEVNILKPLVYTLENDKKQLEKLVSNLKLDIAETKTMLDNLKNTYNQEVLDREQEKKALLEKHENDKKQLVSNLNTKFSTEKEELKMEHNRNLNDLENKYKQQMEQANEINTKLLQNLTKKYTQEKKKMIKTFNKEKNLLQNKFNKQKVELEKAIQEKYSQEKKIMQNQFDEEKKNLKNDFYVKEQNMIKDKSKYVLKKDVIMKKKISKTKLLKEIEERIKQVKKNIDSFQNIIYDNAIRLKEIEVMDSVRAKFHKKERKNLNKSNTKLQKRINEYTKEINVLESVLNLPGLEGKGCKQGYAINPKTKRCVSLKGKVGKKLLKEGIISSCTKEEILNTVTNKCVRRDSPAGRKILSSTGLAESKKLLNRYYKKQQSLLQQVDTRVDEIEKTLTQCQQKSKDLNAQIFELELKSTRVEKEYQQKKNTIIQQKV
jgi:DNA recombination protein RmuC